MARGKGLKPRLSVPESRAGPHLLPTQSGFQQIFAQTVGIVDDAAARARPVEGPPGCARRGRRCRRPNTRRAAASTSSASTDFLRRILVLIFGCYRVKYLCRRCRIGIFAIPNCHRGAARRNIRKPIRHRIGAAKSPGPRRPKGGAAGAPAGPFSWVSPRVSLRGSATRTRRGPALPQAVPALACRGCNQTRTDIVRIVVRRRRQTATSGFADGN